LGFWKKFWRSSMSSRLRSRMAATALSRFTRLGREAIKCFVDLSQPTALHTCTLSSVRSAVLKCSGRLSTDDLTTKQWATHSIPN
jgi:hypothetical protein